MYLDDVAEQFGISVLRSQEFYNLGLFSDRREKILSPLFNAKYLPELMAASNVVMVLTSPQHAELIPAERGLAVADNPLESFIRLHIWLYEKGFYWTSFTSRIADSARIHPRAWIAEQDVEIGPRVVIGPNAVIMERSVIGSDSIIGPGTIIGCEGYEPRDVAGQRVIVPHAGGVRIGERVHIQANCSVSRSLYGGFTEIGDESTTDNLVHIAHNVAIGKRCRLAASAMIAGSTVLGDDVWVGPNATVSSSLRIGNRARISLGAVVTQDVSEESHVSGNFAIEHGKLLALLRSIR